MKYIYLFVFAIFMTASWADNGIRVDQSIAIEKAKIELKEFAFVSGYEIENKYLNHEAKVLMAKTKKGIPVIKVLFAIDKGSYEVIFGLDKDGWLERKSVGASIYNIEKLEKEFYLNPSFGEQ